jgi:hypothetical protein
LTYYREMRFLKGVFIGFFAFYSVLASAEMATAVATHPWETDAWTDKCEDFMDEARKCVKERAGQGGDKFFSAIACIGFYESKCDPKAQGGDGGNYHGGFQFNRKAWANCFKHFPQQMKGCSTNFPSGAYDVCCAATCTAMHVLWGAGDTQFETGRKQCKDLLKTAVPDKYRDL